MMEELGRLVPVSSSSQQRTLRQTSPVKKSNILECRVCEDTFQLHGDKIPRLLFCGHTLCHACLLRSESFTDHLEEEFQGGFNKLSYILSISSFLQATAKHNELASLSRCLQIKIDIFANKYNQCHVGEKMQVSKTQCPLYPLYVQVANRGWTDLLSI